MAIRNELSRALERWEKTKTNLPSLQIWEKLKGYLLGEDQLQGQAAAVDVKHGDGHVVLLGFRPQWRGQPSGTFRTLFNASLFHGEVARSAVGADGFWVPPADTDQEEEEGN